jgi:hypothetical protein
MARRSTQALDDFASGLIPYSEAERERDREGERRELRIVGTRRRALISGRHYDQPGTPESRARDLRVIGEAGD